MLLALGAISVPSARAETLTFHASQSGMQTLDQGEGGGNPFASALIEVLGRKSVRLAELAAGDRASSRRQEPQLPAGRRA